MNTIVVLGITSTLGAEFLMHLANEKQESIYIVALVRPDSGTNELKTKHRQSLTQRYSKFLQMVEYTDDNDLIKKLEVAGPTRLVNLAIYEYQPVLVYCQQKGIPTLSISSGAVTDWVLGRHGFNITQLAQNPSSLPFAQYIEKKLLVESWSTLSIRPGYYLPGAASDITGSGLHIKSGKVIFCQDPTGKFKASDWDKRKYITPLPALASLLLYWVRGRVTATGVYSFGSDIPYQRHQLREFSGLGPPSDDIQISNPVDNQPVYRQLMGKTGRDIGIKLTHDHIISACVEARRFYEQLEKN